MWLVRVVGMTGWVIGPTEFQSREVVKVEICCEGWVDGPNKFQLKGAVKEESMV